MAAAVARNHNAIYFNCGWAINQSQFRDAQLQNDCIISQLKPAGTKKDAT